MYLRSDREAMETTHPASTGGAATSATASSTVTPSSRQRSNNIDEKPKIAPLAGKSCATSRPSTPGASDDDDEKAVGWTRTKAISYFEEVMDRLAKVTWTAR